MNTRTPLWHQNIAGSHLAPLAFEAVFDAPLSLTTTPAEISRLLRNSASAPVSTSEEIRKAVRDALRAHGYKPTGRGKPASEYLIKAVERGWLAPDRGINLAVDACNAVSLHSGLPVSVVDVERTVGPRVLKIAPEDTRYIFNPSGQHIAVGGLWCMFDEEGVCASPVKDSQRTKTHDGSRRTLSVIWGVAGLEEHGRQTQGWYRELLQRAAVQTHSVPIEPIQQ